MDEILQRLTEVSIRQQQIVEHLATRQGETEQGLAELRTAATQRVPLPDPRVQAAKLLPKMTPNDDVEAYLQMFEIFADRFLRALPRSHRQAVGNEEPNHSWSSWRR